jgi:hypothetical protein
MFDINKTTQLILYILLICSWAVFVAVNPFDWAVFSIRPRSGRRGGAGADAANLDPDWNAALARIALLSDNLTQAGNLREGQSLNLRSKRQVSSMMGEIARDLEPGRRRIQRYSGFMWAKIAANFSIYFANERSRRPVDAETISRINYWLDAYRSGVQTRDIRLFHAAVANLVFITETGEFPPTQRIPSRPENTKLYRDFKRDIDGLVSGEPRNVHGRALDRILDKWAPLAISNRDPYLYLLLMYLSTYRRAFSSLYKYAIASRDQYILLDYTDKMSKLQDLILTYVNALARGDMLKQYTSCLDLATLAQIATGKDKYLINRDNPAPYEN